MSATFAGRYEHESLYPARQSRLEAQPEDQEPRRVRVGRWLHAGQVLIAGNALRLWKRHRSGGRGQADAVAVPGWSIHEAEKELEMLQGADMLVTMKTWNAIRDQFVQWEKDQLNAAITGETICPKGIVIDENVLPSELAGKLKNAKAVNVRSALR